MGTSSQGVSRGVASAGARQATVWGTKGSKNQRRAGSDSASSSRRTMRSFLRSSMPSRMVSSHSTSPLRPFIMWAPTSSDANSG